MHHSIAYCHFCGLQKIIHEVQLQIYVNFVHCMPNLEMLFKCLCMVDYAFFPEGITSPVGYHHYTIVFQLLKLINKIALTGFWLYVLGLFGFSLFNFIYYFGHPNICLQTLLMKVNPEKHF